MFYLASTRFINATYQENKAYRTTFNEVAIYGTLIKIQYKYSIGAVMFVIEMNNETNKIEGIGLIKNIMLYDAKYKIYKNNDYNRCIYKGDYWISREQILQMDSTIIEICDLILFKGKSHLKRQTGITILTEQLFTNWILFKMKDLKSKIKKIFISEFQTPIKLPNIRQEEDNAAEEEEIFEIIPMPKNKNKNKNKNKKTIISI